MIQSGATEKRSVWFRVLSDDQIAEIKRAAFEVMSKVGFNVLHEGARKMLKQAVVLAHVCMTPQQALGEHLPEDPARPHVEVLGAPDLVGIAGGAERVLQDLDGNPVSYGPEQREACLQDATVGAMSAAKLVRPSAGWDKVVWSFPGTGALIGTAGIVVAAPNGEPQVIVGAWSGGSSYWYVLAWVQDSSDYLPVFTSETFAQYIRSHASTYQ